MSDIHDSPSVTYFMDGPKRVLFLPAFLPASLGRLDKEIVVLVGALDKAHTRQLLKRIEYIE